MADSDSYWMTLSWPYPGARHVILTGTFDNWSKSMVLKKGPSGRFEGIVSVPYGKKTLYKFIVDGRWCCVWDRPTEYDNVGNLNNVLFAPEAPANLKEIKPKSEESTSEISQPAVETSSSAVADHAPQTDAVASIKHTAGLGGTEAAVDKVDVASIQSKPSSPPLAPEAPVSSEPQVQAPRIPITIVPVVAPMESTVSDSKADINTSVEASTHVPGPAAVADTSEEPEFEDRVIMPLYPISALLNPVVLEPKAEVNTPLEVSHASDASSTIFDEDPEPEPHAPTAVAPTDPVTLKSKAVEETSMNVPVHIPNGPVAPFTQEPESPVLITAPEPEPTTPLLKAAVATSNPVEIPAGPIDEAVTSMSPEASEPKVKDDPIAIVPPEASEPEANDEPIAMAPPAVVATPTPVEIPAGPIDEPVTSVSPEASEPGVKDEPVTSMSPDASEPEATDKPITMVPPEASLPEIKDESTTIVPPEAPEVEARDEPVAIVSPETPEPGVNGIVVERPVTPVQSKAPEIGAIPNPIPEIPATPKPTSETNGHAISSPSTPLAVSTPVTPVKKPYSQPVDTPSKHSRKSSTDSPSKSSINSSGRKKKHGLYCKFKGVFHHHHHDSHDQGDEKD